MTNQSGYNYQLSPKSLAKMNQNTGYSRNNQNYSINDKVISPGITVYYTCFN